MSTALVVALLLPIVFAIIMSVVAARIVRLKRAQSAARVATLRALVAGPGESGSLPAPEVFAEAVADDDSWDLALSDERALASSPAVRQTFDFRTPNSELSTSASQSLFEEPAARTPSRRFAWTVGVGLVMASVAAGMYAFSSGMVGKVFAPKPGATQAAVNVTAATPIELLSLRYAIQAPDTFVVTGLVQNPAAGSALRGVTAVVYLFDAEGRYFASGRSAVDSTVLSPGGETPFIVKVESAVSSLSDLSRYRVSFQLEDGAAVRHVDRRGTLPEGTTGDSVEARPTSTQTPLVTARKSR
jgi:hypothetical protein